MIVEYDTVWFLHTLCKSTVMSTGLNPNKVRNLIHGVYPLLKLLRDKESISMPIRLIFSLQCQFNFISYKDINPL